MFKKVPPYSFNHYDDLWRFSAYYLRNLEPSILFNSDGYFTRIRYCFCYGDNSGHCTLLYLALEDIQLLLQNRKMIKRTLETSNA